MKYLMLTSHLFSVVFFIIVVVLSIIKLAKAKVISAIEFIEAVNIYFYLGIIGSILLSVTYWLNPDAFSAGNPLTAPADFIYFSFVTLTSLGYGDISPVDPMARSISIFLSFSGQIYIAMIISILVALTGIFVAYQTYYKWKISAAAWQKRLGIINRGMFNKWWFDELYHATVIALMLLIARVFAWIDKYIIDGFLDGTAKVTAIYASIQGWFDDHVIDGLVNLSAWFVDQFGAIARRFQTGRYQNYVWITAAVVVVVLIFQIF